MTIKNLFTITAIVCLLFAISLIFMEPMLAKLYQIDPTVSSGAIILARAYGSIMLGLAVAFWTSRNSLPATSRRGLLLLLTISCGSLAITYIHAILTGIINNQGWGLVILTALLASW